jgi:hypothetical protein
MISSTVVLPPVSSAIVPSSPAPLASAIPALAGVGRLLNVSISQLLTSSNN